MEICALERGEFFSSLGEGLALEDCSGGLGLFFFTFGGSLGAFLMNYFCFLSGV